MGAGAIGLLFQSCAGSKIVNGQISGENILVPVVDFEVLKKGEKKYRNYVVVENERLQYPICVFRLSEVEYSALYMQCSHQGAELTVYGDRLHCSAHGSEFDKKGMATIGPAEKRLKTFSVTIENQTLKISLKAT